MRITKLCTIVGLIVAPAVALAQSSAEGYDLEIQQDNMIELNGGHMLNTVFRFGSSADKRTAKPGGGATFGIAYSRRLTTAVWLGGGVSFANIYNTYQSYASGPTVERVCESQMWSIPLFARFDVLKWLYLKPMVVFDIQGNNPDGRFLSNQTGVGLQAALGFDFALGKHWHIGLETRAGLTSLGAFRIRKADTYTSHQRFALFGETINLAFRF
ncbi:MAG: hypothetical protein IJU72_04150 [Bacteroidales bacterium]|nr:hypothetical protein [Bacteroidales bacterium]